MTHSTSREVLRRGRKAGRAAAVPAVVAATTLAGSVPAAVSHRPDITQVPVPTAKIKKVVKVTWREEQDGQYLSITRASKKNGALADVQRWHRANNQRWLAHLTGEKSYYGGALWAFENVHSHLCLAPPVGWANHLLWRFVQRPCGRGFRNWTFTEFSVYSRHGRHFLGYLLDMNGRGGIPNQGQAACENKKHFVDNYFVGNITTAGAWGVKNCIWH